MKTMPIVDFCGEKVSRLICGGNPQSGYSHVSSQLDWEMTQYYDMPNSQALLDECWRHGINTFQSRGYKSAPAVDQNAYAKDRFPPEDPVRMASLIQQVKKPCIAFKIMAASRNCTTSNSTHEAFRFAFENIKPTDIVNVGMFQKYKNQVAENAVFVREILDG